MEQTNLKFINNRIINNKNNEEKRLVWLTMLLFWYMPIASINAHVIQRFNGTLYLFIRYGIFIFGGVLAFISIKTIVKRLSLDSLLILSIIIFQYLLMIVIKPGTLELYVTLGQSTLFAFIWYVLVRSIRDYSVFIDVFDKTAHLVFYCTIVYVVFSGFGGMEKNYSLAYGYVMSIVPISMVNKLFKKIKLYEILVLSTSIILTVAMGARGPLLIIVIYTMLRLIKLFYEKKIKALSFLFAVQVLLIIFIAFFDRILFLLSDLFLKFGLSNRIILQILGVTSQSITESFGRQAIQQVAWESILENPLLGVGIGYDRIVLQNVTWVGNEIVKYRYPHNFFLEIAMHYGVILGIVLSIVILFVAVNCMFKKKFIRFNEMSIIYFSIGFLPLMVSGSYLTSPEFFAFLAICVSTYKSSRKQSDPKRAMKKHDIERGIL